VEYCLRNPHWLSLNTLNSSENVFSLSFNIDVKSLTDNIKSCVVYNNCKSDFFRCENGVRQGENLFPFLFSIFLNDLESYLQSKDVSGLILKVKHPDN
jgi:hypothetical protein